MQKIYVRCLYHGHKKNPTIMEDEPKNVDPIKLTSFQMNAPHVQASILEFIGILYSKEEGYAKPGKTLGLEIENGDLEEEPPSRMSPSEDRQGEQLSPQSPPNSQKLTSFQLRLAIHTLPPNTQAKPAGRNHLIRPSHAHPNLWYSINTTKPNSSGSRPTRSRLFSPTPTTRPIFSRRAKRWIYSSHCLTRKCLICSRMARYLTCLRLTQAL